MTTSEERNRLRATFRDVILMTIGVFHMYAADTAAVTAMARGLYEILRARLGDVARPRATRGIAALRALLNELERTNE